MSAQPIAALAALPPSLQQNKAAQQLVVKTEQQRGTISNLRDQLAELPQDLLAQSAVIGGGNALVMGGLDGWMPDGLYGFQYSTLETGLLSIVGLATGSEVMLQAALPGLHLEMYKLGLMAMGKKLQIVPR